MIVQTNTARKAPAAKALWHSFLVIWPRKVQLNGEIGTYRVCGEVVMRRWSATYRRWFWARVGAAQEGTR